MALLRNLEQSLSGLLEGTVGRVFRTEVRPTEIARKLAREMEINKRVSLSRTYAPTDYLVYLSPEDRARYAGVEQSIAEELGAYLLEHARRERLVLVRRPLVEFRTDQRLRLGEFGIEARTAPISAAEAPARDEQVGERDVHPSRRDPVPAPAPQPVAEAPLPAEGDLFRPASPVAPPMAPADLPAAAPAEQVEDVPYEDPYAGDPFGGGDASQPDDFGWDDPPPRAPTPEPEPAHPEPEPEPEPEPAADWLDPVEDWVAPPAPAAEAPPRTPPVLPVPPPPRAVDVAPVAPLGGAPWIDPTLARPQDRPPLPPPMIAPAASDLSLLVDGTPVGLLGDRIILGRSRTADVVVSDPSVSRQHVELRRDDRGWYAVDLGSTNGSLIDGEPLSEPRRLVPGMRLTLGHAAAIIEVR